MSTPRVPKPPPTAAQQDHVRLLASKIHYAFPTRPRFGSPLRASWDDRFTQDIVSLLKILNEASFTTLPTLAMGCVWVANSRLREDPRPPTLNLDAIQPVVAGHPALQPVLPKGLHRLKYDGDDFGPNGLLSEEELPDRWWLEHSSSVRVPHEIPADKHEGLPMDIGRSSVAGVGDGDRHEGPSTSSAPPRAAIGEVTHVGVGESSVQDLPPATAPSIAAALSSIPSEDIPNVWIEHPAPCLRCQVAHVPCSIHPLSTSVCAYCRRRKQKCTLTFFGIGSLPGFLAWAYWKILSSPEVFGAPTFTPDSFSNTNLPPISEAPAWFVSQYGQLRPAWPKATLDAVPAASSSNGQSASQAPGRPSTRSSKGKERASSPNLETDGSSSAPAVPAIRAASARATKKPASASAASIAPHSVTAPPSAPAKTRKGEGRSLTETPVDIADASDTRRPGNQEPGSSAATADVDAMEVDDQTDASSPQGIQIQPEYLKQSVTVRGSEFAHISTDRQASPKSPPSEVESQTEAQEVTVPPVAGSWRGLPRLNDVLHQLEVATVAERDPEPIVTADDPSAATLNSLMPVSEDGETSLPQTELLKSNLSIVSGIIQTAKNSRSTLTKQSKAVKERSLQAMRDPDTRLQNELIDTWFEEMQCLGDDAAKLSRQLADTNKSIALLARLLRDLIATPMAGDTLEEVLNEVVRLKTAYEDSVRKYAVLQEDVRPVRRELHRLQGRADAAEIAAEMAGNDAARATEPLLSNLYAQLSNEINALRIALYAPLERLASVISEQGALTPSMLQDIAAALRRALADMWLAAASIGQFVDRAFVRASVPITEKVDELQGRIIRLEGSCGIAVGDSGGGASSAPTTISELTASIDSLCGRVDALERQVADRDGFDGRVRESLARLGVTNDVLRRVLAVVAADVE